MKSSDTRTIARLTAERSTVASASGVSSVDPRSIVKMFESSTYTLNDYRIDPQTVKINRLCDDTVAIAYAVHEDLKVDGKPVKLDAFETSVWQKAEHGWASVLHTESIKGDAFGRDRMQSRSAS